MLGALVKHQNIFGPVSVLLTLSVSTLLRGSGVYFFSQSILFIFNLSVHVGGRQGKLFARFSASHCDCAGRYGDLRKCSTFIHLLLGWRGGRVYREVVMTTSGIV